MAFLCLVTELDSLKGVYTEKEKELANAIYKLEELKKQLFGVQNANNSQQSLSSSIKLETRKLEQDVEVFDEEEHY